MDQDLQDVKVRLATELLIAIANWMAGWEDPTDKPAPGYVSHSYVGTLENCCGVMWSLGLAEAAFGDGTDGRNPPDSAKYALFPPYCKFSSEREIRHKLSQRTPLSEEVIQELIVAYLDLGDEYRGLNTSRDWFVPEASFRPAFEAFIGYDLLEWSERGVRWTERVTPYMRQAGVRQP